jgi:hypothetical protein
MPRRPTGALAAMLREAHDEMVAEFLGEERARRAHRAQVARANLIKAREARQAQRQTDPAARRFS